MNNKQYKVNSKVLLKKNHPCGSNIWKIIRVGVDIKLECCGCGRVVMLTRVDLNKRIKNIVGE